MSCYCPSFKVSDFLRPCGQPHCVALKSPLTAAELSAASQAVHKCRSPTQQMCVAVIEEVRRDEDQDSLAVR